MKKVAILTYFFAENYGAVLQSYALQESISDMGYDVEFVNYVSKFIEKPYLVKWLKQKGLRNYLLGIAGHLSRIPVRSKFRRFRENLNVSSAKVNEKTIVDIGDEYSIFLVGSDQVWNYKVNGNDNTYFLSFVKETSKKYSYAASIGINKMDAKSSELYRSFLKDFSNISVREKSGQILLRDNCGLLSTWNIDPTLLLTKEQWKRFVYNDFEYNDYILVYQIGMSQAFLDLIEKYAENRKKKVIVIPFPRGHIGSAKYIINAGPIEFLNLIYHAEEVFTDSFHCTVFSLLFEKKFKVGIFGDKKETGNRITDLLELLDVQDAILSDGCEEEWEMAQIGERSFAKLEELRSKNLNYLQEILCKDETYIE